MPGLDLKNSSFESVSDTKLKVTTQETTKEVTRNYDLDSLNKRKKMITKRMNDMIARQEDELAEVDALISQCETLGIKSRAESIDARKSNRMGRGDLNNTVKNEIIK